MKLGEVKKKKKKTSGQTLNSHDELQPHATMCDQSNYVPAGRINTSPLPYAGCTLAHTKSPTAAKISPLQKQRLCNQIAFWLVLKIGQNS